MTSSNQIQGRRSTVSSSLEAHSPNDRQSLSSVEIKNENNKVDAFPVNGKISKNPAYKPQKQVRGMQNIDGKGRMAPVRSNLKPRPVPPFGNHDIPPPPPLPQNNANPQVPVHGPAQNVPPPPPPLVHGQGPGRYLPPPPPPAKNLPIIENLQNDRTGQLLDHHIHNRFGQAALTFAKEQQAKFLKEKSVDDPTRLNQQERREARHLLYDNAAGFKHMRQKHAGLNPIRLGSGFGQQKYLSGAEFGSQAHFVVKAQKTVGRDPGSLVYNNPFRHPEKDLLDPKALKEAYADGNGISNHADLATRARDMMYQNLTANRTSHSKDTQRLIAKAERKFPGNKPRQADYFLRKLKPAKRDKFWVLASKHYEKSTAPQMVPHYNLTPDGLLAAARGNNAQAKARAFAVIVNEFSDLKRDVAGASENDTDPTAFETKQAMSEVLAKAQQQKAARIARQRRIAPENVPSYDSQLTLKEQATAYVNSLKNNDRQAFLTKAGLSEIKRQDPEALKTHMIKGDFAEADRMKVKSATMNWTKNRVLGNEANNFGTVRLPANLAKVKAGGSDLGGWAYRTYAAESRHDVNFGVVKEALATDELRELATDGMVTQKLNVGMTKWDNGYPKLMPVIKFIDGSQAAEETGDVAAQNARFSTFEGKMCSGYMVDQKRSAPGQQFQALGNEDIDIDKKTEKPKWSNQGDDFKAFFSDENKQKTVYKKGATKFLTLGIAGKQKVYGPPSEPIYKESAPMRGAGQNYAALISQEDRDIMGGTGANKGKVGQQHMAVLDPGHAYEGTITKFNDDGTFRLARNHETDYQKKFKNTNYFESVPLSEKVRGIQKMKTKLENGDIGRLFDLHAKQWDGSEDPRLDFKKDILELKEKNLATKQKMVDAFENRLQVYDNNWGLTGAQQDATLDLCDDLEKLTSESDWKSADGMVELHRPRIKRDDDGNYLRQRWDIGRGQGTNVRLSTTVDTAEQMQEVLKKLSVVTDAASNTQAFNGQGFTVDRDNDGKMRVSLELTPDQVTAFKNTVVTDQMVKDTVRQRNQ